MTDVDTRPSSPEPPDASADTGRGEGPRSGDLFRLDKSPRGWPELRVLDQRWPQFAASVLAVTTGVGVLFWMRTVYVLLNWCGSAPLAADCAPPADWVRYLLLSAAIPGIIAGIGATSYLVNFAATGRTWRNWHRVTYTFGGLVLLWLAVFVVAMIARP